MPHPKLIDDAQLKSGGRTRRVLNTGSGPRLRDKLHRIFAEGWTEVRLDIDPNVQPDLVGSVVDMNTIPDGTFDAIWSSHNVEHLHAHEVLPAFKEFGRVLKPDGFALINCPDLHAIARLIVAGRLEDAIYVSAAGPITALDMLFGFGRSIASGNLYMAHNTGFTVERIGGRLVEAGFPEVRVTRQPPYDLWALALMADADVDGIVRSLQATSQLDLSGGSSFPEAGPGTPLPER